MHKMWAGHVRNHFSPTRKNEKKRMNGSEKKIMKITIINVIYDIDCLARQIMTMKRRVDSVINDWRTTIQAKVWHTHTCRRVFNNSIAFVVVAQCESWLCGSPLVKWPIIILFIYLWMFFPIRLSECRRWIRAHVPSAGKPNCHPNAMRAYFANGGLCVFGRVDECHYMTASHRDSNDNFERIQCNSSTMHRSKAWRFEIMWLPSSIQSLVWRFHIVRTVKKKAQFTDCEYFLFI